jgi:hypothetical protein
MARKVRFAELAIAGMNRLFPEEWRQQSAMQSLMLTLGSDALRDARRCVGLRNENFMLRGFSVGFEIRVLFEVSDDVTVWSVTRGVEPP